MSSAAEVLGGIVGVIDINPKLPIIISEEPPFVSSMNLWLETQEGVPQAYLINPFLENMEKDQFTESRAVYLASYQSRLRAQMVYKTLELLPDVDIKHIGSFRDYVIEALNDGCSPEEIDCEFFAQGAVLLWAKRKERSLATIHELVSEGASKMLKILTRIKE